MNASRNGIALSRALLLSLPLALYLAPAAFVTSAMAGEIMPYTAQEFDRLTHAGKPVLVDVSAGWCPTCKAQKPVLDSLMEQPAYRDVTMLKVDFDKDRAALKRFRVSVQSTLIAYKGRVEVGRLIGETDPKRLDALVRKTVQ